MSIDVEMQKPESRSRGRHVTGQIVSDASRPFAPTPRPSFHNAPTPSSGFKTPATTAMSSTSTTPAAPIKVAPPPGVRLTPEEMDQRRVDGLCFNCPEKLFSREHLKQCTMKGIYFLHQTVMHQKRT
ncbi:unnamed protein product [Urochloa humidicola]